MRRRIFLAVVAVFLAAAAAPTPGLAGAELENLTCAQVSVRVRSTPSLGILEENVAQTVLTGMKARVPKLSLSGECADILRVTLFLQDISTNSFDVYYGVGMIQVERDIRMVNARAAGKVAVWSQMFIMHGSSGTVHNQVDQNVSNMIRLFAERYYEAGNP
ncbi:MAG: hypothetical protein C4293_20775 [Nitrospiraceae bacterium]